MASLRELFDLSGRVAMVTCASSELGTILCSSSLRERDR